MSYEQNKADFEKALGKMKDSLDLLTDSNVIQPKVLVAFESVIEEYEIHFKSDIEELKNECDKLTDFVESI